MHIELVKSHMLPRLAIIMSYIGILSLGDISSRCPRVVWLKLMDTNIEHETKRLLLHNSLFIKWICNEMVTI